MFSHVQTVFLVGGGPSLRGFDWSRLETRPAVAINRAHERLPRAQILWWSDYRFFAEYRHGLEAHGARLKATFRDSERRVYPAWVTQYRNEGLRAFGLIKGGLGTGNSSGYAAINLAYQMGARRLALLGYDFGPAEDGAFHWHEPYPWGPWGDAYKRAYTDNMLPHFQRVAKLLKALGVRVAYAGPGDILPWWPRLSHEELLHW